MKAQSSLQPKRNGFGSALLSDSFQTALLIVFGCCFAIIAWSVIVLWIIPISGILGVPLGIILGVEATIAMGVIVGMAAFLPHPSATVRGRTLKTCLAASCMAIQVYASQSPDDGVDCSQVKTREGYDECLERMFQKMTLVEGRTWLVANGYTITDMRLTQNFSSVYRDLVNTRSHTRGANGSFHAYRHQKRPHAQPFGSRKCRWYFAMPPAPGRFTIYLFVDTQADRIIGVQTNNSYALF